MIHVNNAWGRTLADAHAAGLYRVQSNGKVKMSTRPGEHQGLGLAHYLWASSPLRRYSDLDLLVRQEDAVRALGARGTPGKMRLVAAVEEERGTYLVLIDLAPLTP